MLYTNPIHYFEIKYFEVIAVYKNIINLQLCDFYI